jgi:hypothetical protein
MKNFQFFHLTQTRLTRQMRASVVCAMAALVLLAAAAAKADRPTNCSTLAYQLYQDYDFSGNGECLEEMSALREGLWQRFLGLCLLAAWVAAHPTAHQRCCRSTRDMTIFHAALELQNSRSPSSHRSAGPAHRPQSDQAR